MATEKVGVYRKYRGPVPADAKGQPLPKNQWVDKRPFSWAARWFGTDGKRYSKSFKTRKEAERFAETKQADVRKGKADQPQRRSLREFSQEHKQLAKGSMARTTLIMQLAVLRMFAERVRWECVLQRVHSLDIEAFRAWRSETEVVPATVNKEVKQLKRLFNVAISRGYLPKGANPCDGVALLKVGEKRPKYVSPAQFELLYAKATTLLAQTLLVVLYTARLRLREAMHLLWDDIDFDRSILHVARREADGYVQAWTPKDHERREIPLPKHAIDLLRQLKQQAPPQCPYVFMDEGRWDYYRQCIDQGQWPGSRPDQQPAAEVQDAVQAC